MYYSDEVVQQRHQTYSYIQSVCRNPPRPTITVVYRIDRIGGVLVKMVTILEKEPISIVPSSYNANDIIENLTES